MIDKSCLGELEREVMQAPAAWQSRKAIARGLALSPHTVADHVTSAYRKLGVSNRVAAVRRLSA